MAIRYYKCEKEHMIALELDDKAFAIQNRKFKRGHAVCPHCRGTNGNQPMVTCDPPDESAFTSKKEYSCRHGHITALSLFKNGYVNVNWGSDYEQFENIEGKDFVLSMIVEGKLKCRAIMMSGGKTIKPRICNCKLKPLDDSELTSPSTILFKTTVRVGDIWDKAGCPEPKHSKLDKEGALHQTEFGKRNTRRMKQNYMYRYDDKLKKQVKFKRTREGEKQGEVMKKPTTISYRGGRRPNVPTESEIKSHDVKLNPVKKRGKKK